MRGSVRVETWELGVLASSYCSVLAVNSVPVIIARNHWHTPFFLSLLGTLEQSSEIERPCDKFQSPRTM